MDLDGITTEGDRLKGNLLLERQVEEQKYVCLIATPEFKKVRQYLSNLVEKCFIFPNSDSNVNRNIITMGDIELFKIFSYPLILCLPMPEYRNFDKFSVRDEKPFENIVTNYFLTAFEQEKKRHTRLCL